MIRQATTRPREGGLQTGAQVRVFSPLYLRHRLATSPLAGPLSTLRHFWNARRLVRNPELGLLLQEERMIVALLTRMVQADWNCLDAGAHVGSMSYLLARLAPNGHHAMIEASPDKAAMLSARFPNTDMFPFAVCDSDGEVTFYENLDAPGFSSLARRQSRGRVREITVPARRIDALIGPDRRFDLIKIDLEGFEYAALKGAGALLARCRPVIQFEAGALNDPDVDMASYDALFTMLTQDLGYDVFAAFDLYHDRPPISAEAFISYRTYPFLAFNYFAIHPDQARTSKTRET